MRTAPITPKFEGDAIDNLMLFVCMTHTYPSSAIRSFAITLTEFYDPSVGYVEVPQPTLAEQLSVTRQTISGWTKQLEETGLWDVVRSDLGESTRYCLSQNEKNMFDYFLDCRKVRNPFSYKPIVKIAPNASKKRTNVGNPKVVMPVANEFYDTAW